MSGHTSVWIDLMQRFRGWQRNGQAQPGVSRYRRTDGTIQAAYAGHIVLLDAAGKRYYGFDGVGARIWEMLASGVTAENIVERIVISYDVSRDEAEHDVHEFLGQLAHAGLIRVAEDE
jgi:hypothetical protein